MKRRFPIVDTVAAAFLVGTAASVVLASGSGSSSYVCPSGQLVFNGVTYGFGSITCPSEEWCGVIIEATITGKIDVKPACIDPQDPVPSPA